jgi:hypothetical protein
MPLKFRTAGIAFVAGAIGVGGLAGDASAAAQLLAHRAVYDLTLGKSTDGASAPVSARGRIVYEFTGSPCEGWVTNFRQVTELQLAEGEGRTSDMRSSTFEEGDGSGFQFKTDTFVNGKLLETVDGAARKSKDGALAIDLSKPAPAKTDIAPGAMFPTAQILRIVEAAKAGDKTAEIRIFDGSDTGQKVFDTMTIIGKPRSEEAPEAAAVKADALKGVTRWPVTVSYFDPGKQDGSPNYSLGFDIYENGVSGALRIDYGTYVLEGKLAKFETLPQKGCDK